MKKGTIIVTVMMLFSMVGVGHAVETEYGELGIDVDATWVSKYIFRGIDILDDKAAFQPSINFDLFDTGFSLNVWSSHAGAGGDTRGGTSRVDLEEWDYTLTYAGSAFDGEQYKTNYALSWVYYDYPDRASKTADSQEFNLALSLPDICPGGVVPSYTIIYNWPAKSRGANRGTEGYIHVFGLGYDLAVEGFLPDNPEQVLSFIAAAVYNDGTYGTTIDHDWSHILWGVSTSIDLPYGSLTPAVYYQTSMDDSVNTEDEFWVGISYGFSF
jgi:hypothetical protein